MSGMVVVVASDMVAMLASNTMTLVRARAMVAFSIWRGQRYKSTPFLSIFLPLSTLSLFISLTLPSPFCRFNAAEADRWWDPRVGADLGNAEMGHGRRSSSGARIGLASGLGNGLTSGL